MAVDWGSVLTKIELAVGNVIGDAWPGAASGASTQFQAIVSAGKQIEQKRASLGQDDYEGLMLMQKRALEGVLQTYVGISLNVAEQAAASAWNVVATALKTAYPALAFL